MFRKRFGGGGFRKFGGGFRKFNKFGGGGGGFRKYGGGYHRPGGFNKFRSAFKTGRKTYGAFKRIGF
jgi:hypothetical protein